MTRVTLGLAMIVKDEAANLHACLGPLMPVLDAVSIVDTGSTDGTVEVLQRDFGVAAGTCILLESECFDKTVARNQALAGLSTDWIIVLDADERVAADRLASFRDSLGKADADACFCPWVTHRPTGPLHDYKLAVFRRGLQARGRVHENMQTDLRVRGWRARWNADLVIDHHPDPSRMRSKRAWYGRRLDCALEREPGWIRYHWFKGYIAWRDGHIDVARESLSAAAASRSSRFPVECLNAHMVLAELHARAGDGEAAAAVVTDARDFLGGVGDDWEVRINFRLAPWLAAAAAAIAEGRLDAVRAYEFAC